MCVYVCVHIYVCMYVYVCIYVYIYIYICVCVGIYAYISIKDTLYSIGVVARGKFNWHINFIIKINSRVSLFLHTPSRDLGA